MSPVELLPSWRAGPTRDAIVEFLDASVSLPASARVAAFDHDGTLWCERPRYVQFDFFVDALVTASTADPSLADRDEYRALLAGDREAMGRLGTVQLALALAELFEGLEPEAFAEKARAFVDRSRHPQLGIATRDAVYRPMLELMDELRRREFTVLVVTGGGTEFVRSISEELYGVPPELVVGTLVGYELERDDGRVVLRRTARLHGDANEGAAKVFHIQSQSGRRPIFAAGNSGGDREMLEWATSADGPSLALLVDHDDEEREFSYRGSAETFVETESITDVATRAGWCVASMADDWATVFAAADRAD